MNIWVYEPGDKVFAGVELENLGNGMFHGLEEKKIYLDRFALYKYIGPYNLIRQVGQNMKAELAGHGFEVKLPYIEIYGHWTNDESKLETDLLMCLK